MNKFNLSALFLVLMSVLFVACSGDSYEKRVKKEKKAIDNFLDDKTIIHTLPSIDFEFDETMFYQEGDSRVYFRINNPGNFQDSLTVADAESKRVPVDILFDSVKLLVSGTTLVGSYAQNAPYGPINITYGVSSDYLSLVQGTVSYMFMSPTLVIPLQKGLGSGGTVDMLVPFLHGSTYQSAIYEAFYFYNLRYTYYKQEGTN